MKKLIMFLAVVGLIVAVGVGFSSNLIGMSSSPNSLLVKFRERFESVRSRGMDMMTITESGTVVEESRQLAPFTRIELNGSGKVVVSMGDGSGVVVRADQALMKLVETRVKDGVLTLGLTPGAHFGGGSINFAVSAKELEYVRTSGSGDVEIIGPIVSDELVLRSDGSGKIRARVETKDLELRIAGSGDIDIGGVAEKAEFSILGSGSVKAGTLSGKDADANVAGSGDVELGLFETIDANIAGSGNLTYTGSPQVSSRVIGSGKIRSR